VKERKRSMLIIRCLEAALSNILKERGKKRRKIFIFVQSSIKYRYWLEVHVHDGSRSFYESVKPHATFLQYAREDFEEY
jgi:hypothetical protein